MKRLLIQAALMCAGILLSQFAQAQTITMEAEGMSLDGYSVENGNQIKLSTSYGEATQSFPGETGNYNIAVHVLIENDGQPQIEVRTNGNVRGVFTYPLGNSTTSPYVFYINNVYISQGGPVLIRGWRDAEANAHARVDKIVFTPVGSSTTTTSNDITMEAENMSLSGYSVENGPNIKLSDVYGEATQSFPGADGFYNIAVNVLIENDGQPEIELRTNGNVRGVFVFPLGNSITSPYVFYVNSVYISHGGPVLIRGWRDAAQNAHARVDKIVFTPVNPFARPTTTTTLPASSSTTSTTTTTTSTTTTTTTTQPTTTTTLPPVISGGDGYQFPVSANSTSSAALVAVPTYNNISLYFKAPEGSASREAYLRYRQLGTSTWLQAQSLWFDSRMPSDIDGRTDRSQEYRGSIVNLKPNTNYEIEALVSGAGTKARTVVRTLNDQFPIAKTVVLPNFSSQTLVITEGGNPNGYVVYQAAPGGSTIDVASSQSYDIDVRASYVIIRGLTLKGAQIHGIHLAPILSDLVIEDNDISGWGRFFSDGFAMDGDSGIGSDNVDYIDIKRLLVQRNVFHNPRAGSNSWGQNRPNYYGAHPAGARSLYINRLTGQFVFRYNKVYSDSNHYFADCIGGESNFSYQDGFPGNDADIHDNQFSQCWDDAIESEGINQNVRIYNNFIDQSYVAHGASATGIGPLYVFRNITNRLQYSQSTDPNSSGYWFKDQGKDAFGGRVYIYHNTMLNSEPEGGISDVGASLQGVISRNNILRSPKNAVIDDRGAPDTNCDFDLIDGGIYTSDPDHEKNALYAVPQFDLSEPLQKRGLLLGSPGQNQRAVRLPNFNDNFLGSGPDMGAVEK